MTRYATFRLFQLYQLLAAARRFKTAAEIAEHFEVSTKTVYRDMDYLRIAGVEIKTNSNNWNNPGFWLVRKKCPCCGGEK